MEAKAGDKVRLRKNGRTNLRGIVLRIEDHSLIVRVDGRKKAVSVDPSDITNFSLAARKAWVTMPERQVGRKKGVKLSDRVSVTLRINRELWERFLADESSGLIADRTGTINVWLKQKLDALERERKQV